MGTVRAPADRCKYCSVAAGQRLGVFSPPLYLIRAKAWRIRQTTIEREDMDRQHCLELAPANNRKASPDVTIAIALLAGVLGALARLYYVSHAQVLQPLYLDSGWGDAGQYYRYAWNLIHHHVFSSDNPGRDLPRPDSFRDPGYPAFLALGMLVTNSYQRWLELVVVMQAILGGMAVSVTALAIRRSVPCWLLALAGGAMAVWPHLVSMPAYVLSENLTTPFFALAIFALEAAARRQSTVLILVAGMTLSLSALCNGVLAPLAILVAGAFVLKGTFTRKQGLIFLAIAACPLLAWSARNATITTVFSPTFRAQVNLVQGSWPTYHAASQLAARHDPVGIQTIEAIDFEINALRADRAKGLAIIIGRISKNPGTYVSWYLSKPALLWSWEIALGSGDIYPYPTRNSPFIVNPIFKTIEAATYVLNGVLAILAMGGMAISMAMHRPSPAALAFAVTFLWVTTAYWIFQSDARYAIPFRPCEIALACVALSAATKRISGSVARPGAEPAESTK